MERRSETLVSLPVLVENNLQNKDVMEEEETDGDAGKKMIRIHVGGLGGSVTEEDLHRLFAGGGGVEGVEIVRTKGRSFAYVDFLPSSVKSLFKLFTTYNGCAWKGGKLRLHEAKEHYLVRLEREWAEDAQLAAAAADTKQQTKSPLLPCQQESHHQQCNTKQLRIFFPALRAVKALPFTGTGKHKYSFQRVQVPSLPIHFCDCEDHSVPSHPPAAADQTQLCYGINEQELNIMNKVMDKLFQSEKHVSDNQEKSTTAQLPNQQQHDDVATLAEDDDDLIVNVVSSNQEKEQKISKFKELRASGAQASKEEGPSQNVFKVQKYINGPPKKKSKALCSDYSSQNEFEAAIPGSKKKLPTHSKESGKFLGAEPGQPEVDSRHVSWSQKSPWRQLLGHRGSSTFSVSHLLTGSASSTEQVQSKSGSSEVPDLDTKNQDLEGNGKSEGQLDEMEPVDGSVEPEPTKSIAVSNKSSSSEVPVFNTKNQDLEGNRTFEGQLCGMELVDSCVEPQPTKSIAVSNKSGRGASWCQQSSWTQLVSDNTASSFTIKQIVPGVSFVQQFGPKPKGADSVSSSDSKLKEILKQDNDKFARDGSSSSGIGKEWNALISPKKYAVENDSACAPDDEKNCDLTPKQASVGNVEIGETCSFMRTASSLKEWAKIKAALSGLKRKNVEN